MTYGDEVNYTYSVEGLMEWDDVKNVFDTGKEPLIDADTTLTDGKNIKELVPGSYDNLLIATGISETDNYKIIYGSKGDLTIKKRSIEADIIVNNKVYDGNEVELVTTISGLLQGDMFDGKLLYTYYEITDEGIVKLDNAPVDAGYYAVEVNPRESKYYASTLCRKLYRILKATPDVEKPEVPDILMKEGLKLSEQILPEGWSWSFPDTELELGRVSAEAIYVPSDTRNYNTVSDVISFIVYDEDTSLDEEDDDTENDEDDEEDRSDEGEPRDEEEDDSKDDESEEDKGDNPKDEDVPGTGDDTNVALLMVIVLVSMVGVLLTRSYEHD
jgi:uncharacterized surface anchored protein